MQKAMIWSLCVCFLNACIESTYPRPETKFAEDETHDMDGDGYTENQGDCDDTNRDVHPFAVEVCDEIDNNCNNIIDFDSEETPTWYRDADGDAFGVEGFVYTENSCLRPEGYVEFIGDCDDEDPDTNPEAPEICDEKDNNCNGAIDNDDETLLSSEGDLYYIDADGDTFGWIGTSVRSCFQPAGMVLDSTDCDDSNRFSNPEAAEVCDGIDNNCNFLVDDDDEEFIDLTTALEYFPDIDEDGYGDENVVGVKSCEQPFGYIGRAGDCDDLNPMVYPVALEICDGVDNNCDGMSDGADALDVSKWYLDADGDAYGVQAFFVEACDRPEGYVEFFGDCDDENEVVNPGEVEVCDGIDNDCDLLVDDQDSFWLRSSGYLFYGDGDGDGFGWPGFFVESCLDEMPGMVQVAGDCDDTQRFVNPNAIEVCDGLDNDCDLFLDEDDDSLDLSTATLSYLDSDEDGFGINSDESSTYLCTVEPPYVDNDLDCDDQESEVNPSMDEICDGIDNNCDEEVDGPTSVDSVTVYLDSDSDGFGNGNITMEVCESPEDYVLIDGDCDDQESEVNPSMDEICDGIDNNCDEEVDGPTSIDAQIWYFDNDGDSFGRNSDSISACEQPLNYVVDGGDCDDENIGVFPDLDVDGDGWDLCEGDCDSNNPLVYPQADEICDDIDNNCDDVIDEDSAIDAQDWYLDEDSDGYGTTQDILHQCDGPANYALLVGDCDDTDANRYPNKDTDQDGWEACDGDCDDEQLLIHPYAKELIGDGIDQNCDGSDQTIEISVGRDTTCGIYQGEIRCWGDQPEVIPQSVNPLTIQVGTNKDPFGCMLTANKNIQCWGQYALQFFTEDYGALDVGARHACALNSDGDVFCQGSAASLGDDNIPTDKLILLSVGAEHSCAINTSQETICWGDDESGQSTPPQTNFVDVSAGGNFSCGLTREGVVECWGANDKDQLNVPEDTYKSISAGWDHVCALRDSDEIVCWGQSQGSTPTGTFLNVLAGRNYSCALNTDEEVVCWGNGDYGEHISDADGDGSSVLRDCDDTEPLLKPFDEDGDGLSTCEGDCDDSDPEIGFIDEDGDGDSCFLDCDDNNPNKNSQDNDQDGYTTCELDCNDNNPLVNPTDADGDGYSLCDGDCEDQNYDITPRDDNDGDGFTYCVDCDDNDATIYPGAAYLEIGNGCMRDADFDGWGEDLTDTCCFSLQMQDSYENGWDGATLLIEQDGVFIDEVTLENGSSGSVDVCIPSVDKNISLTYSSGSWDGENTYTLIDPDGNEIFSDGPFPSTSPILIDVDFSQYVDPECIARRTYDSGKDCDDGDPDRTGEDKDGDGSSLCDGDCDDFDASITGEDADRDGFSECNGDCDDSDPFDMLDRDNDGFSSCSGDCNDYDFWTNELATDKLQDGIDQDCDGNDQIIMVTGGRDHTCAIGLDGKIGCWGYSVTISDMPTDDGFSYISAGHGTTSVIDEDNYIQCWGLNCNNLPESKFRVISQGISHGCGIDYVGSIQCWGSGESIGEIPEGDFLKIAVGDKSTCALNSDLEPICWGQNLYGDVSEKEDGPFTKIVAGQGQYCGLDNENRIQCWGDVGDENIPSGTYIDISVGFRSGCALNESGIVRCWGLREDPPDLEFTSLGNGYNHACGVDSNDLIHCWGNFETGKIDVDTTLCTTLVDSDGDGYLACEDDCNDLDPNVVPVDIDGDGYNPCTGDCDENDVTKNGLDVDGDGSSASCDNDCNDINSTLNTRDRDGDGWTTCDGDCDDADTFYNLDDGDNDSWTTCDGDMLDNNVFAYPYTVDSIQDGFDQDMDGVDGITITATGSAFYCVLDAQGELSCDGDDTYAQVSDAPEGEFRQLSTGSYHACVLQQNNEIDCWGKNTSGQTDSPSGEFVQISTGEEHSCALDNEGKISCWGTIDGPPSETYTQISSGVDHACAVGLDGALDCWGDNSVGQSTPPLGQIKVFDLGNQFSCAVLRDNRTECWGSITNTPYDYAFTDISAGDSRVCGIFESNTYCWDVNGTVELSAISNGLEVSYYEVSWSMMQDFADYTPYATEVIDYEINDSSYSTFLGSELSHNVAALIEGSLYVDGGSYEFRLGSDDGSLLYIDDELIIDNDGGHSFASVTGSVDLEEGYHSLRLEYFQGASYGGLVFEWNENGSFVPVPADRFYNGVSQWLGKSNSVSVGLDYTCIVMEDNHYVCIDGSDFLIDSRDDESFCIEFIDDDLDGFSTCDNDCDDKNALLNFFDTDEDGLSTCDGDCNDTDATTGASDNDQDGTSDCSFDCDPNSQWARLHATEYVADGIDQDCDGEDLVQFTSSKSEHNCAINSEQELRCWGRNSYGQTDHPEGKFTFVSVGSSHSCALDINKEIQCWGDNSNTRATPPLGQFYRLDSSDDTNCALDENGEIQCWGRDSWVTTMSNIPSGSYLEIEVGNDFACVLDNQGAITCWGSNTNDRSNVPEGIYLQFTLGENHGCALNENGEVVCWGSNNHGQTNPPEGVFTKINAGWDNTCALDIDGYATCWGYSGYGALSHPNISFKTLGMGYYHGCGIDSENNLHCWGYNSQQQSTTDNDGDGNDKLLDCDDYNKFLNEDDIDGDGYSTCDGDRDDNDASINLDDVDGDGYSTSDGDCNDEDPNVIPIDEDGDGFSVNCDDDCDDNNMHIRPFAPEIIGDGIDQDCDGEDQLQILSSGKDYVCAINIEGEIRCWGNDSYGQVSGRPTSGTYELISSGAAHSCAMDSSGQIHCWGNDYYGSVSDIPDGDFVQLSLSPESGCALDENGEITCWGYDREGKNNSPEGTFLKVEQGYDFGCAMNTDRGLTCWGESDVNQSYAPFGRFVDFSLGQRFGCALNDKGEISCWGDNYHGQTEAPDGTFVHISAGYEHACAIDTSNQTVCWGYGGYGYETLMTPDEDLVMMDVGDDFACGIDTDGELRCWGSGSYNRTNTDYDGDGNDQLVDCDDFNRFQQKDDVDEDGYSTCDGDRDDNDASINLDDVDGDGYSTSDGDCNDEDPNVIPIDEDGDGFSVNCDDDCDDNNMHIRPFAPEIIGDGIDQDCDGEDQVQMISAYGHYNCGLNTDSQIRCWGGDYYGSVSDAPEGVFGVVESGSDFNCTLNGDGEISCWGYDSSERLDHPDGVFKQLSLADAAACALGESGEISCWGYSRDGKNNSPEGTFLKVEQGYNFSCAMNTDRSLTCWGGNNANQSHPPLGGFVDFSLGYHFGCALDYNGEISCWGDNYYGQTDAPEGTFIDIFVGHYTACALDEERLMTCWGYSGYGNIDAPEVEFLDADLGASHVCGVDSEGGVQCWGSNNQTQSYTDFDGDGNDKLLDCNDFYKSLHVYDYDGDGYSSCDGDRDDYDETSIPVDADGDGFRSADGDCDDSDASVFPIDADGDGFSANCDGDCDDNNFLIRPGAQELFGDGIDQDCDGIDNSDLVVSESVHNCALNEQNEIICWGHNNYGQTNAPSDKLYYEVDIGDIHSCAIADDGSIACWGSSANNRATPPEGLFSQIDIYADSNCALNNMGEIHCWGVDRYDKLSPPEGNYLQVALGYDFACALNTDLEIECWGGNNHAEQYPAFGRFSKIALVRSSACALSTNGHISCWGSNADGLTTSPEGVFVDIVGGLNNFCARDADGNTSCWGNEDYSKLQIPESKFSSIALGAYHSCGINSFGGLQCWGQNYYDVLNIDSDGDGADFFSDCDDSDANNTIGSSSDCPGLSCAAILDVHSSSVDGNYFIDPREEGGFEVECDMSNGGFTKVFYQDTVEGYLSNLAEAQSINSTTPTANHYSILDYLSDIKFGSDYEFRMAWPNNTVNVNHWLQSSNPVTTTTVSDYSAVDVTCLTNLWRGLALSSNDGVFIDGTDAEDVWYSVGVIDSDGDGDPDYNEDENGTDKSNPSDGSSEPEYPAGRIRSGCTQNTSNVELWLK